MAAPHILIAGAGIGGLTAALALTRIGADVTVLERAPDLQAIGAGLQLSPNATRILGRLGLLDRIEAIASRPSGIRVRGGRSGRTLSFLPLDDAARRWGAPYLVAHRADLQQTLAAAVADHPSITLHLGTALAGFGTTPAGVGVTAKHGLLTRSFSGDALIGADGIRSSVRARLVETAADAPRETGRTAWRALVPLEANASGETGLWLGRDAHLVHYPLRQRNCMNLVAIAKGRLSPNPEELWAQPGDPALIQSRFAGWHEEARNLVAAAQSWTTWPLFDRAPLPAWNAGPIALLGDAAHPILPFFAQGAAQAIEDAAALAEAVAGTRALPEAFATYSGRRLARATKVQDASRDLGRIYHLGGPAALARDFAMRIAGSRRLLARYDWLYGATVAAT